MNLIRLAFLSFFILLSILTQAQTNNSIILKNGSIIYGEIVQNIPDSIVKIKDKCGNIWAYQYTEVKGINEQEVIKNSYIESTLAFQFEINLSVSAFGGYYEPGLSFLLSGKYLLNDRISAGLSSGVEYFEIPLLPLAAEIQFDLFKRNATPFIFMRGGYGFTLRADKKTEYDIAKYKGGPLFAGGVGIKKRFSSDFALTFSLAYRHQQTFEERDYLWDDWWNTDYSRKNFLNRAAFSIGFIF
jgi:hypothetical protein